MINNFTPIFDKVLVRRDKIEEKSVGGIILSEISQEKKQTGTVMALGNGKITPEGNALPFQVNIGDIVFFGKYAGIEIEEEYLLLKEEEILGIIK